MQSLVRHLSLWTPLASLALALSWVLPNASPPWIAFHKDAWLGGVLCVVALVFQVLRRAPGQPFQLDPLSAVLLGLAMLTVWQWHSGTVHFAAQVALAAAHFGGAALAIVVAREWARQDEAQLGDFLFLAIALAALVNSFLLLVQWLQLDWTGIWIQEVPFYLQPFGNLNQPNNAATLTVLGAVAMSWFAYRRKLRPSIWFAANAYLAFFVAVTGSRIGHLSFVTLVLMAWALGWKTGLIGRSWRRGLLGLLAAITFWAWFIQADLGLFQQLDTTRNPQVFERDLTSIRLYLWQAFLHAAWVHPWLGHGFEQGFLTQLSSADLGYRLDGLYTWSHNVLLDIATWFGLPAALVVTAMLLWVLWSLWRTKAPPSRWIFLAGVYAILLHGMVELPLAFAYFLLPMCLMTGAMVASLELPSVRLPRAAVAAWTVAMAGLLGAISWDYLRIEAAFYTWRFEHSRIGTRHPMDIPDALVMDQFRALLVGLRGNAQTLSRAQVDEFEKAIVHEPSAAAIQHLAELRMNQGDVQGARRAAYMAAVTVQPRTRKALQARWTFLTQGRPEFADIRWEL